MNFKKEVTISDVIALIALFTSIIALYQVYIAKKGLIIQGGGQPYEYFINQKNKCLSVISFPVEFHNSGEKAVVLKHLTNKDSGALFLTSDANILKNDKIKIKLYKSSFPITNYSDFLEIEKKGIFIPSYNHINDLIKPNDSYIFYYIIAIDDASQKYGEKLRLYFSMNSIFDNEQNLKTSGAIELASDFKKCKN